VIRRINKTLSGAALSRLKILFPHNAVGVFSFLITTITSLGLRPAADLFIEKEATINDELDKLRLSATKSLFERRDALIVASVSCIYGLGSPEAYYGMMLFLEKGRRSRAKTLRTNWSTFSTSAPTASSSAELPRAR